MLVDAKIVNADPEHPVAAYEAGQELEGPAAELQVALGHAQALPEAPVVPAALEPAAESESAEVLATQAALDHAQALGVDISAIQGTGKDGKVIKADVEAAVAAKEAT